MSAFSYHEGHLYAEAVPLERIAEQVGTPVYVYSTAAMSEAYERFTTALAGLDAQVFYALKANSNQAILRSLARLGAGADVVSEGELRRALAAGIAPEKIVFAGVGKQAAELKAGLDAGILQFNVESREELLALDGIASDRGVQAPVAIRVNPDVDAGTHDKIATGRTGDKFGVDLAHAEAAFMEAQSLPGIELVGLAIHIGSQLMELTPFRGAFMRAAELFARLRKAGLPMRRLDLGGGLGISYREGPGADLEGYAKAVRETTAGLGAELAFEPGRFLVGNAGVLLTRVIYLKEGAARRFVIIDAAMNDLVRPTLYEAWHDVLPLRAPAPDAPSERVDLVGPVCESGDFIARQRPLPPIKGGDLLAIASAGAYGAVMASTYNSRLLVPEVLVRDHEFAIVRPRLDYDALIRQDRIPNWLEDEGAESDSEGVRRRLAP